MKDRYSIELEKFQNTTIELLAHKFETDYLEEKKLCPQEEIEHYYQIWAPSAIREIALRNMVWRRIMNNRRAKARSR